MDLEDVIIAFKLGRAATAHAIARLIETRELKSFERMNEEVLRYLKDDENFTADSGAELRALGMRQGLSPDELEHIERIRSRDFRTWKRVAGLIIQRLESEHS
jgi:hypothetical protein